jgi:hypothetical protein
MKVRSLTAIFLVAAIGALPAVACGSDDEDGSSVRSSPPPATDVAQVELRQSNDQGGVEIDVTWITPDTLGGLDSEPARAYGLDDYVLLEVQFTTHSGDLSQLDMTALSGIRVGGKEYAPEAWESMSNDSHHRAGVLVFDRVTPDGASLDAGAVELVMKGIAGVPERVFRWQWPVRSG